MTLTLQTAPTEEPISLTEAKLHCRVFVDDENALITSLIIAARQHVEAFTHRALVTQSWDYKVDGFPCDGQPIWLPLAPLLASSPGTAPVVTYTDQNGDSQTWASSYYTVDAPTGPYPRKGRIFLNYGQVYPMARSIQNAVQVRFSCGYGAAAAVPDAIKAGMKLLIAHWYANREAVNVGNIVTPIPQTIDALLWPFKSF